MGSLLEQYQYTKKVKDVDECTLEDTQSVQSLLGAALKNKQYTHKLIPHMIRISEAGLEQMQALGMDRIPTNVVPDEVDASNEDADVDFHCESDGSDDEDTDENAGSDTTTDWRVWNKKRRPKTFTVLPVCKLRPMMAYYGPTAMVNLYSSIQTASNKKRKRESAMPKMWTVDES